MDSEEILSLYPWEAGACFHCARTEVDTTLVGVLHPKGGPAQEIRACQICLLLLEADRQCAAHSRGVPYEPGHLSPDDEADQGPGPAESPVQSGSGRGECGEGSRRGDPQTPG